MTDIKFIGTNQVELVNSLSENKISPVQSGESFIEFSFDSALSKDSSDYFHFEISGQNVQVSGQITEVHNDYQFFNLFAGCEQITDASQLILSAPTMKKFCYANMFLDCTNLTTPPQIQASTLDQWCYSSMFGNCYSLTAVPVLSATTLADYCYFGMFYNCKALSSAPNLPAQTLEDWCYNSMFYNCQNLTSISADFTSWTPSTATTNWVTGIDTVGQFYNDNVAYIYGVDNVPENWEEPSGKYLTFIADGPFQFRINKKLKYKSYNKTFKSDWQDCEEYTWLGSDTPQTKFLLSGNENIVDTKFVMSGNAHVAVYGDLKSLINWNNMANGCFRMLFQDCRQIIDASELILSSMTLTPQCYNGMFRGCYNLKTPPSILPATTLANYCYLNMFSGCTSLTSTPALPATGLATGCYAQMFAYDTSLTDAPSLPATTLIDSCYNGMFFGCSKLSSIEVNFIKWGQFSRDTAGWLGNNYWPVAPTGIFTKPSGLPEEYGESKIPSGWTVVNK